MPLHDRPLFDPFASSEVQTEDAVSKGMISREDADALNFAGRFVELNLDWLVRAFPGQAVSVVADEAAPDGVALYAGPGVFEAENNARQFAPGRPYATLNPSGSLPLVQDDRLAAGRRAVRLAAIESRIDSAGTLGRLLQDGDNDGGLTDEELDELEKKMAELEDKFANGLSDAEFAKTFGPRLEINGLAYTGGKIVAGNVKNFKDWGVDPGATTSSITQANLDLLKKKGAQPKVVGEEKFRTPTGIATFKKYGGIVMQFVRTGLDGKPELVNCDVPVIVSALDLLAQDQRKKTGTTYFDDPAGGTFELKARPKPKAPKKK